MLLTEVALGAVHKITRDDSSLVKPPKGTYSFLRSRHHSYIVNFSYLYFFLVCETKPNHHLKGGKGGRHFLVRERHKMGIAAVPLISGVLFKAHAHTLSIP